MVDNSANKSGSPGLYGNTQAAEFMVDNVSVVPNESMSPPAGQQVVNTRK